MKLLLFRCPGNSTNYAIASTSILLVTDNIQQDQERNCTLFLCGKKREYPVCGSIDEVIAYVNSDGIHGLDEDGYPNPIPKQPDLPSSL